jgi:hypothetical protein
LPGLRKRRYDGFDGRPRRRRRGGRYGRRRGCRRRRWRRGGCPGACGIIKRIRARDPSDRARYSQNRSHRSGAQKPFHRIVPRIVPHHRKSHCGRAWPPGQFSTSL